MPVRPKYLKSVDNFAAVHQSVREHQNLSIPLETQQLGLYQTELDLSLLGEFCSISLACASKGVF